MGVEAGGDAWISGYDLSVKVSQPIEVKKAETAEITLTNSYEEERPTLGSLMITKTIDGTVKDEDLDDLLFTVRHTDTDTLIGRYHLDDLTRESDRSYSKILTSLLPGTYTITETGYDVDGYILDERRSVITVQADVTAGGMVRAALKNCYEEAPGQLTITKKLEGLDRDTDPGSIAIEVLGPDGWETSFTLAKIHNRDGSYRKTFYDLRPGVYTVRETDTELNHYTLEEKVSVTHDEVTLSAGGSETIALKNTYTRNPGKLTLRKTFHGVEADALKDILFTIRNEETGKIIDVIHFDDLKKTEDNVYEKTIEVEPGTYSVTESNEDLEGYTSEKTYSVRNGTVTVEIDGKSVVSITNIYQKINLPHTPPTGDRTDLLLYALIGMAALVITGILFKIRRKYSR